MTSGALVLFLQVSYIQHPLTLLRLTICRDCKGTGNSSNRVWFKFCIFIHRKPHCGSKRAAILLLLTTKWPRIHQRILPTFIINLKKSYRVPVTLYRTNTAHFVVSYLNKLRIKIYVYVFFLIFPLSGKYALVVIRVVSSIGRCNRGSSTRST